MKKFLLFVLLPSCLVKAQNLQLNISNSGPYKVSDQMLGVNSSGSFQYINGVWKRFLDPATNYTTFTSGYTDAVTALGFRSYYFPGGSLARYYHYDPAGHGYCFHYSEVVHMDSIFNTFHDYWGTEDESHDNENEYHW